MVHIYSGDGKGKTTAAVGLAIRAAGAGLRVHFCQFLKNGSSSEIAVLRQISGMTVRCCNVCNKFSFQMNEKEREAVRKFHNSMLDEVGDIIDREEADMIVLDEILGAYNAGLADSDRIFEIIGKISGNEKKELILTGRSPEKAFLKYADYHSNIEPLHHPFTKGIQARKGIEF